MKTLAFLNFHPKNIKFSLSLPSSTFCSNYFYKIINKLSKRSCQELRMTVASVLGWLLLRWCRLVVEDDWRKLVWMLMLIELVPQSQYHHIYDLLTLGWWTAAVYFSQKLKLLTYLFFTARLVSNIVFPPCTDWGSDPTTSNDVELPQTALPCAASFFLLISKRNSQSDRIFRSAEQICWCLHDDVYSLAFHYLMDVLQDNKSRQSENFKIWQRAQRTRAEEDYLNLPIWLHKGSGWMLTL